MPKPPLRIYSMFGSLETSILSIFDYFSVPQHDYDHQKSARSCMFTSISDLCTEAHSAKTAITNILDTWKLGNEYSECF